VVLVEMTMHNFCWSMWRYISTVSEQYKIKIGD